ncbi:MAG: hypothetical protein BIFFINMI_00166 [Phycisphaerae bacterium]|nr:hypothetical protein [Phycisphaerae bacterium]
MYHVVCSHVIARWIAAVAAAAGMLMAASAAAGA